MKAFEWPAKWLPKWVKAERSRNSHTIISLTEEIQYLQVQREADARRAEDRYRTFYLRTEEMLKSRDMYVRKLQEALAERMEKGILPPTIRFRVDRKFAELEEHLLGSITEMFTCPGISEKQEIQLRDNGYDPTCKQCHGTGIVFRVLYDPPEQCDCRREYSEEDVAESQEATDPGVLH